MESSAKSELSKLIEVSRKLKPADFVIKNCQIVDVYQGRIVKGDIAICGSKIAGIGSYSGADEVDVKGAYALPGLIDSHIHIESAYVTPQEFGRMVVPHGTATIIADPHEITNVCGLDGLNYMLKAAKASALDIKYMLPSCVPATPFEHAGAVISADDMREPLACENILGLGEFMNFVGVLACDDGALDKLLVSKLSGKLTDGHSPGLCGADLQAYAASGIGSDHECSTLEEMSERLSAGMYVMLRQGSACHDLRKLAHGVTVQNSRRCLLCSDDRQPMTIFEEGHIDGLLRICVEEGIDPVIAVQMATLNAAEYFRLYDRGAIAPSKRADIVIVNDLSEFKVQKVWIAGEMVADCGEYIPEVGHVDDGVLRSSFDVRNFSKERLKLHLRSDNVHVIGLESGTIVTKNEIAKVERDGDGCFRYTQDADIVKIAVIERHKGTGNVGLGLLGGYGIKSGAIAISIAHDSHNIITVGTNDEDMEFAVNTLIKCGGGIVLAKDKEIIEQMELPLGGIMSERSGQWVSQKLLSIHEKVRKYLGISGDVEPVMTLCFMSLVVIPKLKINDGGLFDVSDFSYIDPEAF